MRTRQLTVPPPFSMKIISALSLVLLTATVFTVSPFLSQTASAETEYQFNDAEKRLMQRYKRIRLQGNEDRFVVDTTQSSQLGGLWCIVHPGNQDFKEHWDMVMASHHNSESANERFRQAWENATAAEMSKLVEQCPKPQQPLEIEEGYPTPGYSMIATSRRKKKQDGTIKYETSNDGTTGPEMEPWAFQPVIVKDDKILVIRVHKKQKNARGEWEPVYLKDKKGKNITDENGEGIPEYTKAFRDYRDNRDNAASRRVYNRYYAYDPPKHTLVLIDTNGVLFYKALPDGTLIASKEWNDRLDDVRHEVNLQQHAALRMFAAIESEIENGFSFFMEIRDANGIRIKSLPIPLGSKHPEWIKALRIIQKKSIGQD